MYTHELSFCLSDCWWYMVAMSDSYLDRCISLKQGDCVKAYDGWIMTSKLTGRMRWWVEFVLFRCIHGNTSAKTLPWNRHRFNKVQIISLPVNTYLHASGCIDSVIDILRPFYHKNCFGNQFTVAKQMQEIVCSIHGMTCKSSQHLCNYSLNKEPSCNYQLNCPYRTGEEDWLYFLM